MDQNSTSTASSTPDTALSYITPIGKSFRHSQRCPSPHLQVPARKQGPTIAASCLNGRLPLAKVPRPGLLLACPVLLRPPASRSRLYRYHLRRPIHSTLPLGPVSPTRSTARRPSYACIAPCRQDVVLVPSSASSYIILNRAVSTLSIPRAAYAALSSHVMASCPHVPPSRKSTCLGDVFCLFEISVS